LMLRQIRLCFFGNFRSHSHSYCNVGSIWHAMRV